MQQADDSDESDTDYVPKVEGEDNDSDSSSESEGGTNKKRVKLIGGDGGEQRVEDPEERKARLEK